MKKTLRRTAAAVLLVLWSVPGLAQTADEIIEKHLAAAGGRAALGKLTSRTASGSIALTTPVGELTGSIAVYAKAPNKSRTLVKLDLSALGGGEVISDQRFDGSTGYVIDTFNGNREITGSQLEALKNGAFPSPLLNYRDSGSEAALTGKDNVDGKESYVIRLSPKTGPPVRMFIDTESLMLVRTAVTINVPQLGGDVEQVIEFSDFRDIDGVKVPHAIKSINSVQTIRSTITDVKHNTEIDDSSFVRPAGQ
jgi:outer membrane lipoprotein-sorting protein